MSIAIVDQDKVLFSHSYGDCDSTDVPFVLGALSESFTSLAVMQLAEQGKISLDDPVSKYLPTLRVGEQITVRQLLSQTSGFSTYEIRGHLRITDSYNTFLRADVNYGLLGEIVAAASGERYEDYIEENIFAPIGMDHSYTSLEEGKRNGLIPGYRNYFGLSVPQEVPFPDGKGWLSVSADYLISSASDMGKYLQMYLKGGNGIVTPESINTMFYDDAYNTANSTGYGMGWILDKNYREPVLESSGLVENYMSKMFILPQSGAGAVLLFNTNDYFFTNGLINRISENVLLSLTGESSVPTVTVSYYAAHSRINLIYLAIFTGSVLPLLFLRRWVSRARNGKKGRALLIGIPLHLVYPTALLLALPLSGVPLFAVRGFVPDLFWVLIMSALLSYFTGIVKLALFLKAKREREDI